MTTCGREIIAQLYFSRAQRWLVVDIGVGNDVVLSMIVNPGHPASAISPLALDDLSSRGSVSRDSAGRYHLRDVSIEGRELPDVYALLYPAVGRLRVDGILGFDFARNFTDVCLVVPSLRLTLRQ